MLALFTEISLRHFLRTPLRSLLVVVGITLGIALYVATEAAAGSMLAAFGEFVSRVSGRADLTVMGDGLGVPGDLLATVAETPGVEHAAVSLEVTAQATELGESLLVLGVDFLGDMHFLPFSVTEGDERVIEDPLVFVNDPTAVLLSKRFAERHGLTRDSRIRLLTSTGPRDFFVRGVLADKGPAASFGGQVAVMFLDAAQVSFARGTFVDRIDVSAKKGQDLDALGAALAVRVGRNLRIERPDRIGTRLRSLVVPLHAALWVSGFLALLVGGFLVYNAVGVAVAQRRREIGLLRALGATRANTTLLFVLEAAVLALPGTVLGLLLGRYLSRYSTASTIDTLNRLYASVPQVEPRVSPSLVVQALVAGLGMAMLAAYWPARRGAALDPAIVLRGPIALEASRVPILKLGVAGAASMLLAWLPFLRGSRVGGALAITFTLLGAALATPGVVVLLRKVSMRGVEALLGVPARLGLDYVERTLGRSTVNVLALMVAVGMSVSVGGWLSSLERSIVTWAGQVSIADLAVTQGSPVIDRKHIAFSAETAARIAAVPGVRGAQRLRVVDQQARGVTFRLVATDTELFLREAARRDKGWQVVSGDKLAPGQLSAAPRILLSENAAERLHARVGDTLVLPAPKGEVRCEVRAIIVDYTSETGAGFIDFDVFAAHWGDSVVDGLFVYLEPNEEPERVASAIRAAVSGSTEAGTVFVTQTDVLEQHIVATLHETFSYSSSVELMTLLVALMGVIGTMAAAIIDRQREISMLRAVGATTGQVALAIVVEAAFLGLCAAVAGIGVGIVECHIFFSTLLTAQTGWHLDFVFPIADAVRTGALVVATSALAGGFPAYRAARAHLVTSAAGE